MFSDMIELLGLASIVAGVFVLIGLGWALLAAGGCMLLIGAGVDDDAVLQALGRAKTRAQASATGAVRRVRTRRARPKVA